MTRTALLFAIAAAPLLVACDPIWKVSGTITQAPGAAPAAVEGSVSNATGAIRDAKVTLTCAGWTESATTDFVGQFKMGNAGWLAMTCKVKVEKPGFVTQEIDIKSVCTQTISDGCHSADVKMELVAAQ